MSAFVAFVKATFGNSPDVLADFGLKPRKARTPLTIDQMAAAVREARRNARRAAHDGIEAEGGGERDDHHDRHRHPGRRLARRTGSRQRDHTALRQLGARGDDNQGTRGAPQASGAPRSRYHVAPTRHLRPSFWRPSYAVRRSANSSCLGTPLVASTTHGGSSQYTLRSAPSCVRKHSLASTPSIELS